MGDDEPTMPSRQLSSLATLVVRVETVLEQVAAVRGDVAALSKVVGGRSSSIPLLGTASAPVPAEPRPSLAVKAAKGSKAGIKWASIGLGLLTVGVQVLASALTNQPGPIVALLKVLLTVLTGVQGQ
jgi:hypothetical protein